MVDAVHRGYRLREFLRLQARRSLGSLTTGRPALVWPKIEMMAEPLERSRARGRPPRGRWYQSASIVTELGILALWMKHANSDRRWKVEFQVRTE
jgi:hypothetical protein